MDIVQQSKATQHRKACIGAAEVSNVLSSAYVEVLQGPVMSLGEQAVVLPSTISQRNELWCAPA